MGDMHLRRMSTQIIFKTMKQVRSPRVGNEEKEKKDKEQKGPKIESQTFPKLKVQDLRGRHNRDQDGASGEVGEERACNTLEAQKSTGNYGKCP